MLLCKVVYFLVVSKLLCNINFMDVATLSSYSVYIDLSVCVCVCVCDRRGQWMCYYQLIFGRVIKFCKFCVEIEKNMLEWTRLRCVILSVCILMCWELTTVYTFTFVTPTHIIITHTCTHTCTIVIICHFLQSENSNSRTGGKDHQTSNCKFPKHPMFCIVIENL